jgi:hypothetical protein
MGDKLNKNADKTGLRLVSREQMKGLVGPGNATGVVYNGCSVEDRLLFEKHCAEQGQPTKPNRAGRRQTAKAKQKAITKRRARG